MTGFSMAIVQRRSDVESEAWMREVVQGSPAERESALAKLNGRALRTNDPDDWNAFAIGLHHAARHGKARQIFEALVENNPEEAAFRLNLAMSLSQRQEFDLVRYHLRLIADHDASDETRRFAKEQLDGYESFIGATDADQRFRRLQVAGLEERIRHEDAAAEEFTALARIHMQQMNVTGDEAYLTHAIEVLETGRSRFPQDLGILEHLIGCYVRSDAEGRMAEISLELEKLAPESPILEVLQKTFLQEKEAESFSSDLQARAWSLLGDVMERKLEERDAAISELRRIVANLPLNPWYRCVYATALAFTGQRELARREAEKLVDERTGSHSFHFNLAQVLWSIDWRKEALLHLQLAEDLATPDELADVTMIREEWEKPRE